MLDDQKRTEIAAKGVGLADLFAHSLSLHPVNGFEPVLREPAAVSTGGGRAATQHVVLRPPDASQSVLTVGSVNVATKEARLRTYDCLVALQEQRFPDRPFPIARDGYDEFFTTLKRFVEAQGMQVEIETRPPAVAGRAVAPSAPRWPLVVLLLLAVAVGIFLALR